MCWWCVRHRSVGLGAGVWDVSVELQGVGGSGTHPGWWAHVHASFAAGGRGAERHRGRCRSWSLLRNHHRRHHRRHAAMDMGVGAGAVLAWVLAWVLARVLAWVLAWVLA